MKNNFKSYVVDGLFEISKQIENASSYRSNLVRYYWMMMFKINRILEKFGYPYNFSTSKPLILNFGCGYTRTHAISSDLFAIHRYFVRKPRPDLYLTGTIIHKRLRAKFDAIICEHVLEHILPSQAKALLNNLLKMLKPNGSIQISVPSVSRLVSYNDGKLSIDILSINDIAYRYDHKFLHDEKTISALLADAGFDQIEVNSYHASPYHDYLSANREPKSIYVIARRPSNNSDDSSK
jgi:predicted SAM-dependent methyltransferase